MNWCGESELTTTVVTCEKKDVKFIMCASNVDALNSSSHLRIVQCPNVSAFNVLLILDMRIEWMRLMPHSIDINSANWIYMHKIWIELKKEKQSNQNNFWTSKNWKIKICVQWKSICQLKIISIPTKLLS